MLASKRDQPRKLAGHALFQATPTAAVSLAYVSETQLRILRATSRPRVFADADHAFELELEHGTGIAATDLDGDGVTDLVVADAGNLRVLHAELQP